MPIWAASGSAVEISKAAHRAGCFQNFIDTLSSSPVLALAESAARRIRRSGVKEHRTRGTSTLFYLPRRQHIMALGGESNRERSMDLKKLPTLSLWARPNSAVANNLRLFT